MNTILAAQNHVYRDAQTLYDAADAQQTQPPPAAHHQAVNAPVQQRHIRFSTARFTPPTTSAASIPAIWRNRSIINRNRRRPQRRGYSWSDSTASTTEYFRSRTDNLSTPSAAAPGRGLVRCSPPNCSRRRRRSRRGDNSSQDSSAVVREEYVRGHTDDIGLALGRRRTPYRSRSSNIAGVGWTSPTTTSGTTSFLESASRRDWSWGERERDDRPYTVADVARQVTFARDTTTAGLHNSMLLLERVPTPYPVPQRSGFRKWCGKMKAKFCPLRQ